jgi:CheY-like chemotaxis protein
MQVLTKQMYAAPPRPSEVAPRGREIPRDLEELCLSMLHKVPEQRPTAAVVAGVVESLAAGGPKHLRAREESGKQGRAARMISVARSRTEAVTLAPGAAAPDASAVELAVVGALDGDLALGLAANGILPFIVSADQPIGDADVLFVPGASPETLSALRRDFLMPILTDSSPADAERVPALLRAGVDDVVTTPVRADQLARRVWRALRKARVNKPVVGP